MEDFLVQKIEFVRMEIESEMASKAVKMLEQYSCPHLGRTAATTASPAPPSTTSTKN